MMSLTGKWNETIKQNKPDSKRKMSCVFPRMQNKDVKIYRYMAHESGDGQFVESEGVSEIRTRENGGVTNVSKGQDVHV